MHILDHPAKHIDLFQCPACAAGMAIENNELRCRGAEAHRYPVEGGIPRMFCENNWDGRGDVTDAIRSFYEDTPFPNYDDLDDTFALMQKAERSVFGRMLNDQIPFNVNVLEVGCGTGQLANYLGVAHRTVFGTDMTVNALKLAQDFKAKNNLDHVGFYQMNLFRPIFKPESFHVVLCNGVLHHTSDPHGGFRSIANLVKPGGYLLVGLYNAYGRLATDIRRRVFSLFGDQLSFLDPYLRKSKISAAKQRAWFRDQYKNPHESKHTIDEALGWFDAAGFEFESGVPPLVLGDRFSPQYPLFKPHARGTKRDHALVQMKLILTGSREGGFFIIVGKKRQYAASKDQSKLTMA